MSPTCTAAVGPIWKLGGETCTCTLPVEHVFSLATHWHRCSCGCTWVDDQQIDEARRGVGIFAHLDEAS